MFDLLVSPAGHGEQAAGRRKEHCGPHQRAAASAGAQAERDCGATRKVEGNKFFLRIELSCCISCKKKKKLSLVSSSNM